MIWETQNRDEQNRHKWASYKSINQIAVQHNHLLNKIMFRLLSVNNPLALHSFLNHKAEESAIADGIYNIIIHNGMGNIKISLLVKTWCMLQIQWSIMGNDERFNQKCVTAWSSMTCCLQTRSCLVGRQGCGVLWIAYWLVFGLKWEPNAQLCLLRCCKVCRPFSEGNTLKQTGLSVLKGGYMEEAMNEKYNMQCGK
jgi:hypothetical protein